MKHLVFIVIQCSLFELNFQLMIIIQVNFNHEGNLYKFFILNLIKFYEVSYKIYTIKSYIFKF